jgi:hypothetical protein
MYGAIETSSEVKRLSSDRSSSISNRSMVVQCHNCFAFGSVETNERFDFFLCDICVNVKD